MENSIKSIQQLCEAIREANANIADSYSDYIDLAMALSSELGEQGRPYFHELAAYSAKYEPRRADSDYTRVMRNNRGEVRLGTVFYLAEQQGVSVNYPQNERPGNNFPPRKNALNALPGVSSHTQARDILGEDEEYFSSDASPRASLPYFPPYSWPEPIGSLLSHATNEIAASMMTLSAFTVLGSTIGRHARLLYDNTYYYVNLLMGIFGPSGAGKSIVTQVMLLAQPLHDRLTAATEQANARYAEELRQYEGLGKERYNHPAPVEPPQRMHFLPADSTGAAMKQNIVQNEGMGMIYSPEADELSNALNNRFGQWSPLLRTLFDHDAVSYYRKMDRRLVETKHTYVSVGFTGTMGQILRLFQTAEDGLSARPLLLSALSKRHLRNPFAKRGKNLHAVFLGLGREWLAKQDLVTRHGIHTLQLTDEQQQRFFHELERIFHLSGLAQGTEMDSNVFRLGVNIGRLMTLTGLLRALEAKEPYDWKRPNALLTPSADVPDDNVKDGIVQFWDIRLTDADFDAVLSLAYPLYRHATHILSFLPRVEVKHRFSADRGAVMERMPDSFTAAEFVEQAARLGYCENTALSWINRMLHYGILQKGCNGRYLKLKKDE